MSQSRQSWLWIGLGLLLAAILGGVVWHFGTSRETLEQAEALFLAGELDRAEAMASRMALHPAKAEAASALAFRVAQRAGRVESAIGYIEQMPDESLLFTRFAAEAADLAINQLHAFSRAERLLTRAAQAHPDDLSILERQAFLYGLTGRSGLAEPVRLHLVRQGQRTWTLLWLLCLGDDALENTELLAEVNESTDDPLVLFALARWKGERGEPAVARRLLERALAHDAPVEAVVAAARYAREAGDVATLERLLQQTADVVDSPGLWWIRGRWCEEQGRPREAIRCHAEAVLLQPNYSRSLVALARGLEANQQPVIAQRLRERAADLALYLNAVKAVRQEAQRPQWERVVSLAKKLSLDTEAAGWWSMGRPEWQADPDLRETREWLVSVQQVLHPGRIPEDAHPLRSFDVTAWTLPDFHRLPSSPSRPAKTIADLTAPVDQLSSPEDAGIHWADVAAETGLDFIFEPSPGRTAGGPRMFEFTGGGVAVCDFDRDGWIDTWWTQGLHWPAGVADPPQPAPTDPVDRLFRNLHGERWQDVTGHAQATDSGFGQGIATGDLNGDGFPECVVANIGKTVVHWNQGDGTFRTEELPESSGWTTSLAIADLTDDGFPDVYLVRYLGGPEIYTRTCPDADGHPHSCLPQHFPAAADLFLQNTGEGAFFDTTEVQGFAETDGKGLGIAVADFSGDGRLDVFVANDTTPNFCRVRQPAGSPVPYLDEGLVNGLALNGEGRAQADMGIALDDADGNGLFDLFVTKFFNETNTLSLQVEPGVFIDSTGGSGLGDSSLRLLGFGTRFVDADLDGRPDLAITNGHIDDVRHRGEPFEMRPQFYRNLGGGRFRELLSAQIGPFFSRETLGRAMAQGDWNHDGREDLFISHIGSPAAVLENRSTPLEGTARPEWVTLELVGRQGAREPVGAKVELIAGGKRAVKVLAAGDGYQSSDPRQITFGLGVTTAIDAVTVVWPGGRTESVQGITPGRRWVVVEGRGVGVAVP